MIETLFSFSLELEIRNRSTIHIQLPMPLPSRVVFVVYFSLHLPTALITSDMLRCLFGHTCSERVLFQRTENFYVVKKMKYKYKIRRDTPISHFVILKSSCRLLCFSCLIGANEERKEIFQWVEIKEGEKDNLYRNTWNSNLIRIKGNICPSYITPISTPICILLLNDPHSIITCVK